MVKEKWGKVIYYLLIIAIVAVVFNWLFWNDGYASNYWNRLTDNYSRRYEFIIQILVEENKIRKVFEIVANILNFVIIAFAILENQLVFQLGLASVVSYGIFSWKFGYLAEGLLNLFFYFPMQLVGLYFWRKRDNFIKRLDKSNPLLYAVAFLFLTSFFSSLAFYWRDESVIYGNDDNRLLLILDIITVFFGIAGQLLMSLKYYEQWFIWIGLNSIEILKYSGLIENGTFNLAMLTRWWITLIFSVIGLLRWRKYIGILRKK